MVKPKLFLFCSFFINDYNCRESVRGKVDKSLTSEKGCTRNLERSLCWHWNNQKCVTHTDIYVATGATDRTKVGFKSEIEFCRNQIKKFFKKRKGVYFRIRKRDLTIGPFCFVLWSQTLACPCLVLVPRGIYVCKFM